jgi:glycosyltransferase involved in cell wall biosynthesis
MCLTSSHLSPNIETFTSRSILARLQLAKAFLDASRGVVPPYDEKNRLDAGVLNVINKSDCDIVHLHWVKGMLSVEEIARIRKPIVWTLHDMWAFCGDAHYVENFEWMTGFQNLSAADPERLAWQLKATLWKEKQQLISPSQWLNECVRTSALMRHWPTEVIPYPICSDTWHPEDQTQARLALGLPEDKHLILFGAVSGIRDPRKGFHLLLRAMQCLQSGKDEIALVTFGDVSPPDGLNLEFPVYSLGVIQDDAKLRLAYSAADVFIAPSTLEALGQTSLEAQACGTPVVAFNNSGLRDTIAHKQTGYLSKAFEPEDLAIGVVWTLGRMGKDRTSFSWDCRNHIKHYFNYSTIGLRYADLYRRVCERHQITVSNDWQ